MFRRNTQPQNGPGLRDGFYLNREEFELPEDTIQLGPDAKRAVTICNLFVYHNLSLSEIASLLDEDHGKIVRTLITHNLIKHRRLLQGNGPQGTERRSVASISKTHRL